MKLLLTPKCTPATEDVEVDAGRRVIQSNKGELSRFAKSQGVPI